jgi:hypothetical protein
MRIDLNSTPLRICFLGVILLFSGTLTFFSGKALLAAHWNAASNSELWPRSVRLEPGNANYWSHLGLSRQWELSPGGIREAIRELELATQVNPRSADLWMELADAFQASGDPIHAQEAYERAQRSYPISSEIAWRYGSFLLYEGKLPDGYAQIRRALLVDPSLTSNAISECWQSDPNVPAILNKALPAKPEYYQGAMDFFLSRNLLDPALAVWDRERALDLPITMSAAIPLIDALIDQDRVAEARQTWQQALEAAHWPQGAGKDGSLIFNGGFEHDFANGGYDWREVATNGVRFDFDGLTAHSGSRSLRIQFEGTSNLDFHNLFQYVPVDPGTRYHFSAYLRTEGVSTDRGVGFEIFDPRHPSQVQQATSEVLGTNPWTLVQADVVTGPETHFLKIAVKRLPSWKFDNKLSGTVWIDDVALTPMSAASRGGAG